MLKKIKTKIINIVWRKKNRHNKTFMFNLFPINKVTIGKETYGPLDVKTWGTKGEYLSIGNYCSIAEGVKFVLGGEHRYDTLMTYPFKVLKFKTEIAEAISKGEIVIEDDVWISMDVIILSGVRIGQGSIIGAGTVVAKNIPPYSIVVGNPARVIKKRFSDEIIECLLNLDFSKIKFDKIPLFDLYSQIETVEDVEKIIKYIS